MDTDNNCPSCGGPADNGHDREYPPNYYYCSKCEGNVHPAIEAVDANRRIRMARERLQQRLRDEEFMEEFEDDNDD